MNILEIREIYLENLTTICENCFNKIDNIFILSYNDILKCSTFSINVYRVYSDYESSIYFDDVVIKMQQHYSENWDIEYNKKAKNFYFSYRSDLTEVLQSPKEIKELEKIKIAEETKKEFENKNRFDLMDMEE